MTIKVSSDFDMEELIFEATEEARKIGNANIKATRKRVHRKVSVIAVGAARAAAMDAAVKIMENKSDYDSVYNAAHEAAEKIFIQFYHTFFDALYREAFEGSMHVEHSMHSKSRKITLHDITSYKNKN